MKYLSILISIALVLSACGTSTDDEKEYNLATVKVIKGEDVSSLTKQKEYTAVYFWATWCGGCRTTLKNSIKSLLDSTKRDDFQILVVALSKKPEKVQDLIDKAGITHTTYVVNDYTFNNALGDTLKMNKVITSINEDIDFLNQVPVTLLVNKKGDVLNGKFSTFDIINFLKGELK